MSLPSSITADHIRVFDEIVAGRIESLPAELGMTFLMQILPATAISTMATDLSVNGIGGLAQATTETERREVLLNSIRTTRRIGTPGAIKRAVQTLDFSEPIIVEGPQGQYVYYDGTFVHDSSVWFSGGTTDWAEFYVLLPEAELVSLTASEIDELAAYINYYKNERSKLIGIGYAISVIPVYDAQFDYDGSALYDGNPTGSVTFVWTP